MKGHKKSKLYNEIEDEFLHSELQKYKYELKWIKRELDNVKLNQSKLSVLGEPS